MLRSGTVYRIVHLNHHAKYPDAADDPEGAAARLGLARTLWGGRDLPGQARAVGVAAGGRRGPPADARRVGGIAAAVAGSLALLSVTASRWPTAGWCTPARG
jgi:hypothetical protein